MSEEETIPLKRVADVELSNGTRVDRYEIVCRIGQGGMGVVYLARDTQLGRKAALKFIHPDKLGST